MEEERRARRVQTSAALLILGMLSVVALMVGCAVGSAAIPLDQVARTLMDRIMSREVQDETNALIIFGIRLPRALLSFSVGAALSVSGACMQGLFKNSMADPHILGVSSGAALGAALAMILGWQSTALGLGAVTLAAFMGGALSVVLVVNLARVRGRTSTISLLLAGVAVSAFLSALMSGLMLLNRDKLENVYLWTMGSFTSSSWNKVWCCLPVTVLGAIALRAYARDLNAMLMGEEEARSLGVAVERVRLVVLALCTVLTATAVSVSGVIGFVGLMVPHAVRMMVGPDHRSLIPVSVVAGGLYLLIIDTLARTVAMPIEIPVGVLTSVVGGPFFLYLMRKSRTEE